MIRMFTKEEDRKIIELSNKGKDWKEIANVLGRTENPMAVAMRLKYLKKLSEGFTDVELFLDSIDYKPIRGVNMFSKSAKQKLIMLADSLDRKGLKKEADLVDSLIS